MKSSVCPRFSLSRLCVYFYFFNSFAHFFFVVHRLYATIIGVAFDSLSVQTTGRPGGRNRRTHDNDFTISLFVFHTHPGVVVRFRNINNSVLVRSRSNNRCHCDNGRRQKKKIMCAYKHDDPAVRARWFYESNRKNDNNNNNKML